MNPAAYEEMAATEAVHWWFVGRRSIIRSVLQSLRLPKGSQILEVGCGTGGNLALLSSFGDLHAMESDRYARSLAAAKSDGRYPIAEGSCPDRIPFSGKQFDLICLFDVLEHIDSDAATLDALGKRLRSGGAIALTVPAYRWLWSAHDTFLHHKRRYTSRSLLAKARLAGLRPLRVSYFNTLLFPLVAAVRVWARVTRRDAPGTATPPPHLNALLCKVFSFERVVLRRTSLPFGASLLAILVKDDATNDSLT